MIKTEIDKEKMQNYPIKEPISNRCNAQTRSGHPCRKSPINGKKRCRMHGCAKGSGAPKGNVYALKHGFYTREKIAQRAKITKMMKEVAAYSEELEWAD